MARRQFLPSRRARGVRLLRSWPLRALGQKIAYEDLDRCDTADAIRIGRVHCERDRWEEDSIDWLLGGGYSVSSLLPRLRDTRCLLLWGVKTASCRLVTTYRLLCKPPRCSLPLD